MTDWNRKNNGEIYSAAQKITETLQNAGEFTCFVGGCVRDFLLGKTPRDFDLVTTATPEKIESIFPDSERVGAAFGVTLVKNNGYSFEVATAREERNYLDGRHPENVRYTRDLAIDAARRDFTVNALLYDPVKAELLDFSGGREDLERGILRTVGNPETRFSEDYLRMLRAIRFAARLQFTPTPELLRAIRHLAPNVRYLSKERVENELSAMLTGPHPRRAIELLDESGLLNEVLPEIAALKGVTQPPEFHPEGDVFIHTMVMLDHMPAANRDLAWSVLLHDVGKPATRSLDETGRIRFFGHESVGAEMAEKITDRFRFSVISQKYIVQAIRNHMRFASVKEMKNAKLRRLIGDENFPMELELHRLDCLSSHGLMDCWVYLLDQVLAQRHERKLPVPFLSGKDLIAEGWPPSPEFKRILNLFFDRQLAGEFDSRESALQRLREEFPRSS